MENRRPPAPKTSVPRKYNDRPRDLSSPGRDAGGLGARGGRPGRRFLSRDDRNFNARDSRPAAPRRNARAYPADRPDRQQRNGGKSFFGAGRPRNDRKRVRITSDLQILEGKHQGKLLANTASPKMRITSKRVRDVAFKVLSRRVRASRFLDLCAGPGIVGIEAISRGAMIATLVDRSPKMCSFIRKNLETCGIKDGHGEVFVMEMVPFLKKMAKRRRYWDVVFYDPPYDADYDSVLDYFRRGVPIKRGGVVVIAHHSDMFFPERIGVLRRWRVINQGESALSFYERD